MQKKKKLRDLVYGFAIGDALGSPFEFSTPSPQDVAAQFNGDASLSYTDDTFLLLTSLDAYSRSQKHLKNKTTFWSKMKNHTCRELLKWFETGDLRGVGFTTHSSMKQIARYGQENKNFTNFQINLADYFYDKSAGNGILSRALPLLALGLKVEEGFLEWLRITHLHEDGHKAVLGMEHYIQKEEIPNFQKADNASGFYALDTLMIAIDSLESSKNSFEAFEKSQRPQGDNDSNAAMALGLWCYQHGLDATLKKIVNRIHPIDLERLDESLDCFKH
jgi:ADP-ribosylglycohydrolase